MLRKKVVILIGILILILICLIILSLTLKKSQKLITTVSPFPKLSSNPEIIPHPSVLRPMGGGLEPPEFINSELNYVNKTPILQKLPANNTFFEIGYVDEQHLVVFSKTGNKDRDYQTAKNWFIENNIDISTINIEYR